MFIIFHSSRLINSELAYKEWLQENPTGFVVNLSKSSNGMGRKTDANITCIHKASCKTINREGFSAFTTNAYFKCCSPSLSEVEKEAKIITGLTSIRYCSKCF
ncbi:hypothetical protein EWI30_12165 [Enterobacter cloacae]|nr:hypothetical protein EWI30_12165 [Enterobacter cloacae]